MGYKLSKRNTLLVNRSDVFKKDSEEEREEEARKRDKGEYPLHDYRATDSNWKMEDQKSLCLKLPPEANLLVVTLPEGLWVYKRSPPPPPSLPHLLVVDRNHITATTAKNHLKEFVFSPMTRCYTQLQYGDSGLFAGDSLIKLGLDSFTVGLMLPPTGKLNRKWRVKLPVTTKTQKSQLSGDALFLLLHPWLVVGQALGLSKENLNLLYVHVGMIQVEMSTQLTINAYKLATHIHKVMTLLSQIDEAKLGARLAILSKSFKNGGGGGSGSHQSKSPLPSSLQNQHHDWLVVLLHDLIMLATTPDAMTENNSSRCMNNNEVVQFMWALSALSDTLNMAGLGYQFKINSSPL